MPNLSSSMLFLGCGQSSADSFGAQVVMSEQEFSELISKSEAATKVLTLVINPKYITSYSLPDFIKNLRQKLPHTQFVLVESQQFDEDFKNTINTGHIYKIVSSTESPDFELSLREALETAELSRQTEALLNISQDQTSKLQALQKELEDRVQKRQSHLLQSKEKLLVTNRRMEGLHKAIIEIQKAKSIRDIENIVKDSLQFSLNINSVKISFQTSGINSSVNVIKGQYTVALTRASRPVGSVTYLRDEPFTKAEIEFLHQISEAITIAIDRLAKLEEAEILKQQWQDTFDAITESVVILSADHSIIRSNKAFAKLANQSPSSVINKKCYAVLFGRQGPCENCQLGQRFNLSLKKTVSGSILTFEVASQPAKIHGNSVYINIYRDVTEKQRLEKRLVESAKMAELGTIGGSIAHELNNPLAGMLTFAQLIRADLKGGEWYYEDIIEIENGILRCRDIIRDLLGFTRKPSLEERETVDVLKSLQQAIKILELQSKPLGIKFNINSQGMNEYLVLGHSNLLSQALVNVLQDSLDTIKGEFNRGNRSVDTVLIQLLQNQTFIEIEILQRNSSVDELTAVKSIGLSIANQIIEEHGGSLEIYKNSRPMDSSDTFTQAKISLPRLVFDT